MRVAWTLGLVWLTGCGSMDTVDGDHATAGVYGTGGGAPEGGNAAMNGGHSGFGAVAGMAPVPAGGAPGAGDSAGAGGLDGTGGVGTGGVGTGGAPGSAGMAGDSAGGNAGAAGTGGADGTEEERKFSIRFDYRFDTSGFFNAERRAALEEAGAVWSNVLRDDFASVPAGTELQITNPEDRDERVWVELDEDIDDVLVFVGSSDAIPGLGRGGRSGTFSTTDAALEAALVARRDGPDYEPWAGSITFNSSKNYFFDSTPETADDIPSNQVDFITNAAHEIGHILGYSSGTKAFANLTENRSFVGPNARSLYGGPVPLASDGSHFPNHTLFQGMDLLMDTGMGDGYRIPLTALDVTVLSDIGYEIAP